MIPTASSLYLKTPVGMPYNYGGQTYYTGGSYSAVAPQNYYTRSPSSYNVPNPIRLPGVPQIGSHSPMSQGAPTQPLTSNSAVMNDDTPVTTRRFNSYKENRDLSQLNASSASLRMPHGSTNSVQSGTLPPDFGQMLKQVVVEAVRAEKGNSSPTSISQIVPAELKPLEEALTKEREERKNLKAQLKHEKKQVESLQEKLKALEKARSEQEIEMKRMERENANRGKELDILQNELSEMRNERILAEQLDEEHSAKMKVYTQDLMATSAKYQQDIQNLIGRNDKLVKEIELLKAKGAELERQATHTEQVKEALNRKLLGKDGEISTLQAQIDKLTREKKQLESATSSNPARISQSVAKDNTSALEKRIKELEATIESQKITIESQESRISNDAFGVLRSSNVVAARRVSLLTSRKDEPVMDPGPTLDWLEPLKIADHVLANMSS